MAEHVRPRTAVLTRGFDPTLSVGSARPAVFRSSTYVFPSPEEAEHAFDITTGKIQPADGGRADLIYSRFSHPNAEILEDQIVPLDAGGRYAAVFNSGMAAIMTACFALCPAGQHDGVHDSAVRRHDRADPPVSEAARRHRDSGGFGTDRGDRRGHRVG